MGLRCRETGALVRGALLLALASAALPGAAQLPGTQFDLGAGGVAVVTLDQERLFSDSAYGQAVAAAVERSARALTEENRALEQTLAEEELALTEARSRYSPAEFRDMADAFDARVQSIRARQEARGRAIGAFRDAERQRFFEAALPVLTEVVRSVGAVAVLDNRAIVLALDEVDITDRVLSRLDTELQVEGVPRHVPGFGPDDAATGSVEDGHGVLLLPGPRPRPPADAGGPPLDLPSPVVEP
ncbi:MAG: OmpH family outer membrane protein [Alkalilacustris sp.]